MSDGSSNEKVRNDINERSDRGVISKTVSLYVAELTGGKKKRASNWTSLSVQWLRLHTSTPGGVGLILRQGTKVPHAAGTAKN